MTAAIDWTGLQSFPRGLDGLGPGRDFWQPGWRQDERVKVSDPGSDASPSGNGWRSSPVLDGKKWWVQANNKRKDTVRALRLAGYVARRRYARETTGWVQRGPHMVPSWTYTSGPCEGLEAVDPWDRAARLNDCSGSWTVQARVREDGSPLALPIPEGCGLDHVCGVCAARSSRDLARQVRAHIKSQEDGGELALVTLTQRGREDEPLADAVARWRRAWDLMTKGRAGQRFKARIRGYYYGLEVTRKQEPWWHLHAHVVVELHTERTIRVRPECETCGAEPDQPCDRLDGRGPMKTYHQGRTLLTVERQVESNSARDWLAGEWERASRSASGDYGWDPLSGCWDRENEPARTARKRIRKGDCSGGWWRPIDRSDLQAVYQACKYATPITTLSSVHVVEFLSVAHGRRWHQGGLQWRSIKRMGAEALAAEMAEDNDRIDMGRAVCSMAPGHSPRLDDIVTGRGLHPTKGKALSDGDPGIPTGSDVRWTLSRGEFRTAALWESKGYGTVGTTHVTRTIPAPPGSSLMDPRAHVEEIRHRSGRTLVRMVITERTLHPTFTMHGDLAMALLLDTEDLFRPQPKGAGSASGSGSGLSPSPSSSSSRGTDASAPSALALT